MTTNKPEVEPWADQREEQAPRPAEVGEIPNFEAVRDKRMSELSPAEQRDARELWIRDQLGWFDEYHAGHIKFLLGRLDEARAQLTAAGGREDVDWPQQVFELCNFLAGHGWTMTKATHEAWMLSTGDANKYPDPLDALARMALAATKPTQEKPE